MITEPRSPEAVSDSVAPKKSTKDRSQFVSVLEARLREVGVSPRNSVLLIGGTSEEAKLLLSVGFTRITISNLPGTLTATDDFPQVPLDAEHITLPDNSYDTVFVHEVLHHCRSPHKALCEMLRVSRHHVFFLEPNDSLFMNWLVRLHLSMPYEIFAVADNGGRCGGVRNSAVPNFIYRWNRAEVVKVASSFLAEQNFSVHTLPYWDFNVDERELELRVQTRIQLLTRPLGTRNLLHVLRWSQQILNWIPVLRDQGNKLFCHIHKHTELKPWLCRQGGGIVLSTEGTRTWMFAASKKECR